MPRDAAAARLSELIEALPDVPASAMMSAADLVALLPKLKALDVRSSDSAFTAMGFRKSRVLLVLSAFAVMMLVVCAM
jgi:hypothetical protein